MYRKMRHFFEDIRVGDCSDDQTDYKFVRHDFVVCNVEPFKFQFLIDFSNKYV